MNNLSNHFVSLLLCFELQLQRYEGASTIYGPLTLPAYVNQFSFLAEALVKVCFNQFITVIIISHDFFNAFKIYGKNCYSVY